MTFIAVNFTFTVRGRTLYFNAGQQPVYSSQKWVEQAALQPTQQGYSIGTMKFSFSDTDSWDTVAAKIQELPGELPEETFAYPKISRALNEEDGTICIKFSKLRDSFVRENMITDAQIVMDGNTPTLVLTRENVTMVKQ